jgi:hypothetical protein
MIPKKSALAVAIAATVGGASTAADAAVHSVVLTGVVTYSNNGSSAADISSSTATFHYDDGTNLVTQTGGIFEQRLSIVPNVSTLFRHTITGLVMGNGGPASGTSYVCTNGNFGQTISFANLCGNYNFGANFVEESTVTYGPGTAFGRVIGGDDMIAITNNGGTQQSIAQLDGMNSAGLVGASLTLSNAADLTTAPGLDIGYDWVFNNDVDGDGIENNADNCYTLANANQADSDADGFGNRCDGDLNNNNVTNSQDYVLFRQQLGQPSVAPTYNKADLNANGVVNSQDYVLFRGLLGKAPGPGILP